MTLFNIFYAIKHMIFIVCGAIIITNLTYMSALAQLKLNIDQGVLEPIPIALPTIVSTNEQGKNYGYNITQVIVNDLVSSGLFKLIRQDSYIQQTATVDTAPRFGDWRIINAQFLILADLVIDDEQIILRTRIWDVYKQKQVLGKIYKTVFNNWRRVAHKMADDIYANLTGEDKYFESRIVYIAESGPKDKRIKRLAIMDQDGANNKYLTDGSYLVLTPRFSPTQQKITYLSYIKNKPQVFIFDLNSGENFRLGSFKNMTFAPRFTPDGNNILMSYEEDGNSEIFTMNLSNFDVERLTFDKAIDTSPSMAPTLDKITFTSDRGGSPQLYVMNSDGSNQHRISFGKGAYSTPVWSPRGDLIAFTKQHSGRFYIGVMRYDGTGERVLAEGYLTEGPSWSPNGRVLVFFKQQQAGDKTELYSIDITGHFLRKLVTPQESSDPSWSPLLQDRQ